MTSYHKYHDVPSSPPHASEGFQNIRQQGYGLSQVLMDLFLDCYNDASQMLSQSTPKLIFL